MRIKVTGSHRRYLIEGIAPGAEDAWLEKKLHEHRFRSIDRAANAMESVGWVTLETPSAARFGAEEIWRGPFLCLGLRIDRKRLPANALKIRVMEALETERQGQGLVRLNRERRAEIRDSIESELLTRTVPSTQLFQIIWKAKDGEILFSSASNAANAAFVKLFARTFGHHPVAATPVAAARRSRLSAHHIGRLAHLTPASFISPAPAGGRL